MVLLIKELGLPPFTIFGFPMRETPSGGVEGGVEVLLGELGHPLDGSSTLVAATGSS